MGEERALHRGRALFGRVALVVGVGGGLGKLSIAASLLERMLARKHMLFLETGSVETSRTRGILPGFSYRQCAPEPLLRPPDFPDSLLSAAKASSPASDSGEHRCHRPILRRRGRMTRPGAGRAEFRSAGPGHQDAAPPRQVLVAPTLPPLNPSLASSCRIPLPNVPWSSPKLGICRTSWRVASPKDHVGVCDSVGVVIGLRGTPGGPAMRTRGA